MSINPYNQSIADKQKINVKYNSVAEGSDSVPVYVDSEGYVHAIDVRKQKVNKTSSSGTISIGGDSSCNMYYHEVKGATTISLVSQTSFSTFELCLKMPTAYSITFPSSVKWLDNEAPDMSEVGVYYLVFRYDNVVKNWYANLQGMWSL